MNKTTDRIHEIANSEGEAGSDLHWWAKTLACLKINPHKKTDELQALLATFDINSPDDFEELRLLYNTLATEHNEALPAKGN